MLSRLNIVWKQDTIPFDEYTEKGDAEAAHHTQFRSHILAIRKIEEPGEVIMLQILFIRFTFDVAVINLLFIYLFLIPEFIQGSW